MAAVASKAAAPAPLAMALVAALPVAAALMPLPDSATEPPSSDCTAPLMRLSSVVLPTLAPKLLPWLLRMARSASRLTPRLPLSWAALFCGVPAPVAPVTDSWSPTRMRLPAAPLAPSASLPVAALAMLLPETDSAPWSVTTLPGWLAWTSASMDESAARAEAAAALRSCRLLSTAEPSKAGASPDCRSMVVRAVLPLSVAEMVLVPSTGPASMTWVSGCVSWSSTALFETVAELPPASSERWTEVATTPPVALASGAPTVSSVVEPGVLKEVCPPFTLPAIEVLPLLTCVTAEMVLPVTVALPSSKLSAEARTVLPVTLLVTLPVTGRSSSSSPLVLTDRPSEPAPVPVPAVSGVAARSMVFVKLLPPALARIRLSEVWSVEPVTGAPLPSTTTPPVALEIAASTVLMLACVDSTVV